MKQRYYHLAIRRLHQKGMTDQEIVEHLFDLSDEAILHLERVGWNRDNLPGVLVPCSGDLSWTPRKVQHWRLGQCPPLVSQRPGVAILEEAKQLRRDAHAYSHGWGNYCARSEEIVQALTDGLDHNHVAEALGVGWTADLVARWDDRPWDELSPAEVAALDHAAGQDLCLRSVLTRQRRHGADVVGLLIRKGLLIRAGRLVRNGPQRYALAPGVCKHRPADHHHLSGADLLMRRLALRE